jgi:hypothetical protein
VEGHHDVRKEDGGVNAVATNWLQRHLAGELRVGDRLKDRTSAAQEAILGQRTAGLAQERARRSRPDRPEETLARSLSSFVALNIDEFDFLAFRPSPRFA